MKTRNYFFKSCAVIAAMALGVCFVACDDYDDGDSTPNSTGVLDKESGMRLTSVGDSKYYYDGKGRIAGVKDANSYYEFKYNPNKIICSYYYDDEEDDEEVYSVSYNGSGYLSGINNSYSDEYDNGSWSGNIQCTLAYDDNGHLTKMSGSGTESGIEDGERYNDKWTFAYTLSWRNNKLLSLVYNDDEGYTDTWTFSYDDDTYENVYCQWTPSLAYSVGADDIFAHCLYLGLMGVGPEMLPSAAKDTVEDYYDGEMNTYNYPYNFSYGFNNDGSVSYSAVKDSWNTTSWYNFTYDGTDAYVGIRPKATQLPVSKEKQTHRFGRMFKRQLSH